MCEHFKFQLNTRLSFGIGATRKLPEFIKQEGFKRVIILVDRGVAEGAAYYSEIHDRIRKQIPETECIMLRDTKEPDYDYLDEIAEKVRSSGNVNAIIGIGGGSCLDVAKAVSVLMTNPGKGIDYRGFDKVKKLGIPTIAIPTTAGTGSEVTVNAVFTDLAEKRKLGINGRFMNAGYAVIDAEWTVSCPYSAAVSSGMDALTHCLESFSCRQHNRMTRFYSKEAFRLLYRNLPALLEDPQNREKRQSLLLGSHLAAISLFNSGSGIAGAMSYPLGVHYGVPHGIGGGIFLTSVVAFNVRRGYTGYGELLDMVESPICCSNQEKSDRFVHCIRALTKTLEVPEFLDGWGIRREHFQEVAAHMYPLQAAFDQNPVPFSALKDAPKLLSLHIRP